MAEEIRVGDFTLAIDRGGIGILRFVPGAAPIAPALLRFSLTVAGQTPVPVTVSRLSRANTGAAFHGYYADRVTLEGRLHYDPELRGFVTEVTIIHSDDEMQFRLTADLCLPGEADPRFLIPGFFYADNRPPTNTRLYPSFSEVARNAQRMIYNAWAIRSDRAATPVACVWTYRAMAYIYSEGVFGRMPDLPGGIGMTGLSFGSIDGVPTIGIEYPYRESPVKFSFCHEDRTEPEETYVLVPGDTPLSMRFLFGIDEPDLHGYGRIARALSRFRTPYDVPAEEVEAGAEAEHAAHVGLLRWHFDSRQQAIYENATFDRNFGRKGNYLERAYMHAGWLSGILPAFTLLWSGRETQHADSISAGVGVIEKFCAKLAPCGTIFPVWTEEYGWSCSFGPDESSAHSRTVAEAVFFLLRALALEMRYNADRSGWIESILLNLKYAMGSQREDGAFPVYYDLTTGRPTTFDGCGGMAWIAPLAIGSALLQRPHFKEVAIRAGDYYAEFLKNAFMYGSVEDQPLTPTSDDCHWALISYLALYEVDRDEKWLDLAVKAADLALTWRFTYNVDFPERSIPGLYDLKTVGGDISSVSSPTLGCNGLVIYRELLKLSSYTGDGYYRLRAEESRLFANQLVAVEDGQFNAREGMVVGQIFHTDWWQPKGVMLTLSYAMSAALVKYTGLIRRHLHADSEESFDAGEETFVPRKVIYTPAAVSDPMIPGFAAAGPASGGGGVDAMGADSISGSVARILGMTGGSGGETGGSGESPFTAPSPRGQSARGLTSDRVPVSDFKQTAPVPFPDMPGEASDPGNDTGSRDSRDSQEIEIKYKIF